MKIAVIYFELFLLTFTFICCLSAPTAADEKNKFYWYNRNYESIKQKISYFNLKPENLVQVKNVILFVGDGMGLTTVTASRVYKQQKSRNPETTQLVFDEFPASAFIKTDTINSQISESAAAATALFCGVKTNFENLGVDSSAGKDACNNIESRTPSIISWAQNKNLKTGFVTTARITHATPAALYAHSRRHMEDDSKSDANCKDIARQLIENEPGKSLNVIMGGGLRSFISDWEPQGRRKDDRNLTAEWLTNHPNGVLVTDRWQMLNVSSRAEHVLGIFAQSHMHFNADRDRETEPSLAEMTETAIKILKRNNRNGFLLIVEGGKIDLAHHYNNAFRALDDTLALDEAVDVALRRLDLSDSMVIVTADHASSMVYSGFATPKDYSILGMDKFVSNVNKRPYQLLQYSSGLGYDSYNETAAVNDHRNSYHKATIPSTWANHAGTDVPLYAIGSLANLLFSGTMDQTYIPHAIAFAMCLFEYQDRCQTQRFVPKQVEMPRERKPSSVYLLKQQLQKEKFEQKQNKIEIIEENARVKVESSSLSVESSSTEAFISSEADLINLVNNTDFDLLLTSDLIGNLTEMESEASKLSSLLTLILLLVVIIEIVS